MRTRLATWIGLAVALVAADMTGWRARVDALKAKGDAQGALSVLATVPQSADAEDEIGFLLAVIGKRAEAVSRFETALRLDPNHAPAAFHLGVALWLGGEREAALPYLRKAAEMSPGTFDYRLRYAQALEELGSPADAMKEYDAVTKLRPEDGAVWYRLGLAAQRAGNRETAARAYRSALKTEPSNADARNNLGFVLVELGQADAGMAEFHAVLKRDPKNFAAMGNVGFALLQKGEVAKAVEQFKAALAANPRSRPMHYNLGLAYKQQDSLELAKQHLTRALELDPDLVEAHYTLGITHWQAGEFAEAAAQMRAATEKRPAYAEAWTMLGTVLKQQGKSDDAFTAYRKRSAWTIARQGPYTLDRSDPARKGRPRSEQEGPCRGCRSKGEERSRAESHVRPVQVGDGRGCLPSDERKIPASVPEVAYVTAAVFSLDQILSAAAVVAVQFTDVARQAGLNMKTVFGGEKTNRYLSRQLAWRSVLRLRQRRVARYLLRERQPLRSGYAGSHEPAVQEQSRWHVHGRDVKAGLVRSGWGRASASAITTTMATMTCSSRIGARMLCIAITAMGRSDGFQACRE
jgi:tetratricopeptide (TPR) repeat protein